MNHAYRCVRAARLLLPLLVAFAAPLAVQAQAVAGPGARAGDPAACRAITDDRARLDCYDRSVGGPDAGSAAGAASSPPRPTAGAASSTPRPTAGIAPGAPVPAAAPTPTPAEPTAALSLADRRALGSTLGQRWELDPDTKQGRFLIRPYKPIYALPVHWTDNVNLSPSSDGDGNSVGVEIPNKAISATFQFSLKSKLWETIGGSNIDVWAAYTQVSHWQVYTPELSRPFRETNYEPEAFAIWGFDQPLVAGWRARFLGLGINHQSNGRSEPLSRSWNRVIATLGLENGDWSVLVRPWWRISEAIEDDDNPGIENWIGRGELLVLRKLGAHQAALRLRHSLKGGDLSRGSAMLDWAFPVSSYLKGHLQLFSGYGETLVDFNHRQTTIGLGVSLAQWL
jgi:phospholipase A1